MCTHNCHFAFTYIYAYLEALNSPRVIAVQLHTRLLHTVLIVAFVSFGTTTYCRNNNKTLANTRKINLFPGFKSQRVSANTRRTFSGIKIDEYLVYSGKRESVSWQHSMKIDEQREC